ncbi:hypothetical protein BC332_11308 [Capsicum chinense]|nr:hypothetical protein BC332_11308 [Capsicum chinense]
MAGRGMELDYVAPIVQDGAKIVQLQPNDVEQETEKWRKIVILHVVGDSLTIGALERFVASQWNFAAKPKIYYHNEGFFVVLFKSMEDRDAMLASRHHAFNNRPIIVKAWAAKIISYGPSTSGTHNLIWYPRDWGENGTGVVTMRLPIEEKYGYYGTMLSVTARSSMWLALTGLAKNIQSP